MMVVTVALLRLRNPEAVARIRAIMEAENAS